MKYVIIGNSAAAVGCIEGIRQIDKTGEITVISNEPYHTYSRPLISYLLLGKTDEQRMKYRSDSFYEEHGCKTMFGKSVTSIDKDKKCVLLDSCEKLEYDKLLVATGSRPFVPPMEGLETVPKKFTFMSLDDAKALEAALDKGSRVLIVGAGLIGLKCAEGIREKVGNITVVDLADRVLPSILDDDGAALVKNHIEKQGIKFMLSDSVDQFDKNTAFLKSGEKCEFDVLVIAVGVRPNGSLVADIGGKVGRGIVVDSRCETSISNIFSAGDCTESFDITTGQNRVLALLPNAYMQGECAGINMAGGKKEYDKVIPMNAIGFFGLHMITAGSDIPDGEIYIAKTDDTYKKLIAKDGLLRGYILIGDVLRAGIYTSLIREKTPLDTIDYELIKENPQLMAFTARQRAGKLANIRNKKDPE